MIIEACKDDQLRLIGDNFDNDVFRIGSGKYSDTIDGCIIKNSVVELVNNKNFVMHGCKFFNTDFIFKKKASLDRLFSSNYWEKCRFTGTHEGTMFGYWYETNEGPCPWGKVSIRECDFSKSNLLCATFFRTDLETTIFPRWPCFTVIQPDKFASEWKKVPLPFADIFYTYFSGIDAITHEWNWFKKAYKLKIDENEAREALSKLDFVRL